MFSFLKSYTLFPTVARPFYIPTSDAQRFQNLQVLTTLTLFLLLFFVFCHLNGHEMIPHMVLISISYVNWPFVYFLWKDVYSSPLPIFFFLIVLLGTELSASHMLGNGNKTVNTLIVDTESQENI
jgi:hypothetical protein